MMHPVKKIPMRNILTGFGLLLLLAGPALAQSYDDLDNRMRWLENEIQTLGRAVYKGEMPETPPAVMLGADPQARANIEVRLSQMEMEMRSLTGKLEQQNFEINRLRDRLERITSDLEMRVGDVEAGRVSGAPVGAGPVDRVESYNRAIPPGYADAPAVPSGGARGQGGVYPQVNDQTLGTLNQTQAGLYVPSSRGEADPSADYEQAFRLVRDANYEEAEKRLKAFLDAYPGHPLAVNARYWLGETYYVRGDYERAARMFAEAYQKDPKGPKGADNLLKLAMSLAGMGSVDDACVAFSQLQTEYPAGAAPILNRAQAEMEKLGCR